MAFLDNAGVTKLTSYLQTKIENLLSSKQDTLVSGTNIKTINNTSLLGSGNITTNDYATNSQRGVVRPWYYHSAPSAGPTAGSNSNPVLVNSISTTAGKYYAVESDVNGRMFVNVPWTDGATLIDLFYPVGSYYETSDTTFNPNTAWGGTWVLETDGIFHVSGYANGLPQYLVTDIFTDFDNGDGTCGNQEGGTETVALTPSQTAIKNHSHTMAHTHGTGNTTNNSFVITASSGSIGRRSIKPGSSTAVTNNVYSSTAFGHVTATGGSSAANTGGQTEANGAAHENRPPYIAVMRWHRTA